MATDEERLLLLLEAQTKNFERALKQAQSTADIEAAKIEKRFRRMNETAAKDFQNFQNQVRGILAAIGLGVVVRDVAELADVWTRVGNRLASAGVDAAHLASAQQVVADIALRTRANLESTAELFSRMLRSSRDLGASMGDVAAVTELVNKALSGASESERSGAIIQLGQGLGSGRLQGDELRSVLENSRQIAEAIAAEFNTTVGNLRNLGKKGELESRRVFQAILNAAPQIEAAYAGTNATIADSFTNLRTQAARFIGTTEQTSNATKTFKDLIAFTANNFGMLADATIVAATVIGGTFAGIAIAKAVTALTTMIATMTTTAGRAAALEGALAFFGGPLGIALAAAGAGFAYVATQTDVFVASAQRVSQARDSLYSALQVIAGLEVGTDALTDSTSRTADSTRDVASAADAANARLDHMTEASHAASSQLTIQERATRALAVAERERAIATLTAAAADQRALISAQERDRIIRHLTPVLTPQARIRVLDDDIAGRDAIAQARQDLQQVQEGLDALREGLRLAQTQNAGGTNNHATPPGSPSSGPTVEELRQQAALSLARLQHETAIAQQIEDQLDIAKRIDAFEKAGLSTAAARAEAEREVKAERAASNAEAQRNYQISLLQDQVELSRAKHQIDIADALQDEIEIRRRTIELMDQLAISQGEAAALATEFVDSMRQAREDELQHSLEVRSLETAISIAQARGDDRAERALQRRQEIEQRIADLRNLGVGEEAATARAQQEVAALEQADIQGKFRRWFTGGVTAALDGDLGDFFENWLRERASAGLESALNDIADVLFKSFSGILSQVISSGQDGFGSAIAGIFTNGAASGIQQLGKDAADTGNTVKGQLASAAVSAATSIGAAGNASATSAAQEAAAAKLKSVGNNQVISANYALAKAAYIAAAALTQVGTSKGVSSATGGAGGIISIIGSLFKFGGGKAVGGPINAGTLYQVHKDEWIIPRSSGLVIPANALKRGGGSGEPSFVYSPTINFQGTSEELQQLKALLVEEKRNFKSNVNAIVADTKKRRGFRGMPS